MNALKAKETEQNSLTFLVPFKIEDKMLVGPLRTRAVLVGDGKEKIVTTLLSPRNYNILTAVSYWKVLSLAPMHTSSEISEMPKYSDLLKCMSRDPSNGR